MHNQAGPGSSPQPPMMGNTGHFVFIPEPPSKKKSVAVPVPAPAAPAPAPSDKPIPPRPGMERKD